MCIRDSNRATILYFQACQQCQFRVIQLRFQPDPGTFPSGWLPESKRKTIWSFHCNYLQKKRKTAKRGCSEKWFSFPQLECAVENGYFSKE